MVHAAGVCHLRRRPEPASGICRRGAGPDSGGCEPVRNRLIRSFCPHGSGGPVLRFEQRRDVPITLTANGFDSRTLMVHLSPTTYRLTPATLTVTLTGYVGVRVTPTFPGNAIPAYGLGIRASANPTFTLTSSDPSVVKVNTP